MQLLENGTDHKGHPLVTVTPEGSAPYDIDVTMMFCLFGISHGLTVYRAGTCSRLKVRGLVEGKGDDWKLTDTGETVFSYVRPILARFVESNDA